MIEAYFCQLTDGCGSHDCGNNYCSASSSFKYKESNRNQMAVKAIKMVKERAPFCDNMKMKMTKLSEKSGCEEVSVKEDNQDENPATHHVHLETPIMDSASTTTGELSPGSASSKENVESCVVDIPNKTEDNSKQRLRYLFHLIITKHPGTVVEIK